MRALVVIPTYQEAGNIARVLQRVRAAVPEASVLVVDDGSPDGTADLAEATGREVGEVHVLRRTRKAGLGDAYRAGFRWGMEHGAPILVEMDADLQHDPAALPSLLAPIEAGDADLVIGSRYVAGGSIPDWRLHRRLLSRWGNRYASMVLGLGVQDSTAGFRAYRTAGLERIDLDGVAADGYGFQIEMTYRSRQAGGRIVEVPIQFGERTAGESKMSANIIGEALRMVTWWGLRDRVLRRPT
ncbi:MAG TPA: polyprenol monophosphomannose synthase [Acidimicrobiales bacterium]|nr:polyprenol monophosphomannose synthase [Acidimicrobiales bacterium]